MKVYFSHDPKETTEAEEGRFADALRQAGLEPVDSAADLEPGGGNWQEKISEKLTSSDALVFVIGPESERSPWLQREWSASVEESWANPDKPMIPILVGDAELPPFLQNRNAIRVASGEQWEEAARSLVAALEGGARDNTISSPDAERELAAQRQQRLSEIAQEAAKLEPSPGDWEAQVHSLQQQLAKAAEQKLGDRDLSTLEIKLADALRAMGRQEEALPHLKHALERLEALPADSAPELESQRARVHINLARVLDILGRDGEAIPHYRSALRLYEKLEGPSSMMAAALKVRIAMLGKDAGALAAIKDKLIGMLPDAVGRLLDKLIQGDGSKPRGGKGG